MSNAISKDRLKKISDSLFTSKIRYGVQLYGKVRTSDLDPNDSLLDKLQVAQNKCARFLHGTTLKDKINTKVIFKETNLLSVNQINAQIKLTEVWKSTNNAAYPTKWTCRKDVLLRTGLKDKNKPDLVITGKTHLQSMSFINDAAKIWNEAPLNIKESKTLITAKKYIKLFVKTLPI